jgi:hypothetical protein
MGQKKNNIVYISRTQQNMKWNNLGHINIQKLLQYKHRELYDKNDMIKAKKLRQTIEKRKNIFIKFHDYTI